MQFILCDKVASSACHISSIYKLQTTRTVILEIFIAAKFLYSSKCSKIKHTKYFHSTYYATEHEINYCGVRRCSNTNILHTALSYQGKFHWLPHFTDYRMFHLQSCETVCLFLWLVSFKNILHYIHAFTLHVWNLCRVLFFLLQSLCSSLAFLLAFHNREFFH